MPILDAPVEPREFADDLRETVLGLRGALLALYRAVGADPERPQEVARQFGINKNLTWKIAKVMALEDAFQAATLIPGPEGLGIMIAALGIAKRNPRVAEQVRAAAAEFEAMIARHTGDRTTLELLLDGATESRSLEVSRKMAFRGNSGIWGLRARARITSHILAPNAEDPTRVDMAVVSGFLDLCRLRPTANWPLFRFTSYSDGAARPLESGRGEPIEAPPSLDAPLWIMPSWCRPAAPELVSVAGERTVTHSLGSGPVGRMGQVSSCFCGFVARSSESRYGDSPEDFGELGTYVTLPIETLVMDLLVHRSLAEAMHPEARVYGRPAGDVFTGAAERETQLLPIVEAPVALGEYPPRVATPLMPDYEERMMSVFPRLGLDPRDFAAFRLTVEHPPMPSLVVVRYRLLSRSDVATS